MNMKKNTSSKEVEVRHWFPSAYYANPAGLEDSKYQEKKNHEQNLAPILKGSQLSKKSVF